MKGFSEATQTKALIIKQPCRLHLSRHDNQLIMTLWHFFYRPNFEKYTLRPLECGKLITPMESGGPDKPGLESRSAAAADSAGPLRLCNSNEWSFISL